MNVRHRTASPRGLRHAMRSRYARGAAAVELALGLPILVFVMAGAIHFGDAMVVRQRLTTAASRAARICAPRGEVGILDCVSQQVRASMAGLVAGNNRCDPLQTNGTQIVAVDANIKMLTVRVTCQYAGGIAQIVRRYAQGANVMTLRSQASMPITER